MTSDRTHLLRSVSERLGDRALIWAGLRGEDIESLVDLPQLRYAFSIIAPYHRRESIDGLAYEDLSGCRVDLDAWDIEYHLDAPASQEFRRALLAAMREPSAMLPYRSSSFLSAVHFARRDRCISLGLFGAHQAAFEHKPWVEASLADIGVPTIPWKYVADEEHLDTLRRFEDGPMVLRRSHSSGGAGFIVVDHPDQVSEQWPHTSEGFVSVAPYFADTVPLNVGATIWRDGVSVHHPSVQLIGIPECVDRPFGYCGNDFAAAKHLPRQMIEEIETRTKTIGTWMAEQGYRGTFGVDYLVVNDKLLFTEVNPRFQGSSPSSARLSVEQELPCLYLEHIAAMLDVPQPGDVPLVDRVQTGNDLASVVVHLLTPPRSEVQPARLMGLLSSVAEGACFDLHPSVGLKIDRGAVALRYSVPKSLTKTGFDLDPDHKSAIDKWRDAICNERAFSEGVATVGVVTALQGESGK